MSKEIAVKADVSDILRDVHLRDRLDNVMNYVSRQQAVIEQAREEIKMCKNEFLEESKMDPKILTALIKIHHSQNFTDKQREIEQLEFAIAVLFDTENDK